MKADINTILQNTKWYDTFVVEKDGWRISVYKSNPLHGINRKAISWKHRMCCLGHFPEGVTEVDSGRDWPPSLEIVEKM